MERRLAAILAADIVDYSRLMGEDEARMIAALKSLRAELLEPAVTAAGGQVVKRMGDGWLVEFSSIGAAVNCALAIQQGLVDHELIRLRIGIHTGDITFDEEDIFGDGVNVAARLEAMAEPGAILISDSAHNGLDGKAAADFAPHGTHQLKNIARPIEVWRWGGSANGLSDTATDPAELDRPSLVVLPFDNLSNDPEQEYIADGIVEELTSAFSRIRNLFVIARNTAFTFKNQPKDIRAIARDLGVRYVLEGSVRRGGSKLRVSVQLANGSDGQQIWAQNFDGDLEDVFELQDTITRAIVGQLQPTIRDEEIRLAKRKPPSNLHAYDLTMRAFPYAWSLDRRENRKAVELLQSAIADDPEYALAYALLSWCEGQQVVYQWTSDTSDASARSLELARQAYKLDPNDPIVLAGLASAQTFAGSLDEARDNLERALSLDQDSAWAWARYGWLLYYLGEDQAAADAFERALRISPYDPMNFNNYFGLGGIEVLRGNYEAAVVLIERGLREHPEAIWANRLLCAAYAQNGQLDKAQACVKRLLIEYPDLTTDKILNAIPFRNDDFRRRYREGLLAAGLPAS